MALKKYAVVCAPPRSFGRALSMKDIGQTDVVLARVQWRNYCQMLRRFGFSLITMCPVEHYPDCTFVEDPAVIIGNTLIITRLQRPERQGEEVELRKILQPLFSQILHIEPPGFIEGGDVLVTDGRLYVGLSGRTNSEGANQLARYARDHQKYLTEMFEIPPSHLHLKGGVAFHKFTKPGDKNIVSVSEEIAHYFENSGCELIRVPSEERFGANCISDHARILVHARRPRTRKLFEDRGFDVQELDLSEFEKKDGAMTCLSKFFTIPPGN